MMFAVVKQTLWKQVLCTWENLFRLPPIHDAYWWPQFIFTSVAYRKGGEEICWHVAEQFYGEFSHLTQGNKIYQFQITISFICPTRFVDSLKSFLLFYDAWCRVEIRSKELTSKYNCVLWFRWLWLLHFARHKPLKRKLRGENDFLKDATVWIILNKISWFQLF